MSLNFQEGIFNKRASRTNEIVDIHYMMKKVIKKKDETGLCK